MKSWTLILLSSLLSISAFGQRSNGDLSLEDEINAAQGKPEMPAPRVDQIEVAPERPKVQIERVQSPKPRKSNLVDEENRAQDEILRRKYEDQVEVSPDRNLNRFPVDEPIFKKPPGPKRGGAVRVEHPRAEQGLIRINKDGSYQYRTPLKEKSHSSSFKVGMMTPPTITTENSQINYESMYGSDNIYAFDFDYTWQPFRQYGALGLKVGAGFAMVTGSGFFKNQSRSDNRTRSEESYSLFIVPISAFLEYRFEFVRRQWIVPFVSGGGTYYGLAEVRNDGIEPTFSGAPAVGGGGGVMFSISRLDAASAFTMSQEYGIADMWLVIEARAMQGLSEDVDFSNQTISAGIAVDF